VNAQSGDTDSVVAEPVIFEYPEVKRVPKIFKILRVLRLLKLIRLIKYQRSMTKIMNGVELN